ncbi:cytochrome b/b6 domain-containing protein [Zoogloea sp.]|uniref:cytochrome b/b6 domain-containing protein n=1 Tax=Zoogloea sp. TaxID=49181 RepID=UPI0031FC409D
MTKRVFMLPLWIRLWHWSNALAIIVLAVTGMSLHFSDPALPLVEFSLAARIHNVAGVILVGLYAVFVIGNIVTGNWWQYVPKPPGIIQRCLRQMQYYGSGIFKGEPEPFPPTPETNFNALQAVTYWSIMYLVLPAVIVSGLIFLYPQFSPDTLFGLDGLLPIALVHYLGAAVIILFVVSHIYLGTMGPKVSSLFKMMFTGWYEH